jgi:hypothetical protein
MNTQSIASNQPGGFEATPHAARPTVRGLVPFLGHFAEMFTAMMIGMLVVGMPLRALQEAVFGPASVRVPELRALGMAVAMTLAMVAWMRFRHHSWRASTEMGAAMLVPTVALFPLLWADIVSGGMLMTLGHSLMLPSMLAAMAYRRGEYGL